MAVRFGQPKATLTPGAIGRLSRRRPPQGLALIPTEIGLARISGQIFRTLSPSPIARFVRRRRGAAAARIAPRRSAEPFVAWLPSRSKKLLPRFITAAPATIELMVLGVESASVKGAASALGEGLGVAWV